MVVGQDTQLVTLIGKPLGQSFAARMQNRAYEVMGLNMHYSYTEADQRDLERIVSEIREGNYVGFAVTKPNKVEILKYLDELDPLCSKIGSCNTVVKQSDGRLVGYNTDGYGFYESIHRAGIEPAEHTFLCIGSGGVGRAICSVLAFRGARKIYINDIVEESAASLVNGINRNFAMDGELIAEYSSWEDPELLSDVTVVINASGIGMGSTMGRSPISSIYLRKDQFCFDACYNPAKTQFLLDAESKGCRTLNGLEMSLFQGMAQVSLWTGQDAPEDEMRAELERIMAEMQ